MKTKLEQNNATHPQTVEVPVPLEVHPSVSPLAAELLMRVVEEIGSRPENYNQQNPVRKRWLSGCESPCCIIGWMEHFAGQSDCSGAAVGLTKRQYDSIFSYGQWGQFLDVQKLAKDVPASVGIARIEHFLRTGE